MSTQHKPGPWVSYAPSEQESIKQNAMLYMPKTVIRIASRDQYIGMLIKSHPNEPDPTLADIRLMAAAPELLQALKNLFACMQAQDLEHQAERPTEDQYMACMEAAAKAINKATGGQQ